MENNLKKESKKLSSYIIIGLFTTGLTWLLWTLFINLGSVIEQSENPLWFSSSQFLASFLIIGVSLYLNRKITFRDCERRHKSKITTIIHFYMIYGLGAFLASIVTLIIQNTLPNLNLELIKLFGIFVNVGINYLGQRFWIFKN